MYVYNILLNLKLVIKKDNHTGSDLLLNISMAGGQWLAPLSE